MMRLIGKTQDKSRQRLFWKKSKSVQEFYRFRRSFMLNHVSVRDFLKICLNFGFFVATTMVRFPDKTQSKQDEADFW